LIGCSTLGCAMSETGHVSAGAALEHQVLTGRNPGPVLTG